jgi:Tfp pilus assembly ATPase PilU
LVIYTSRSHGCGFLTAEFLPIAVLYKAEKISLEEALKNADSRNDLEAKVNFG